MKIKKQSIIAEIIKNPQIAKLIPITKGEEPPNFTCG